MKKEEDFAAFKEKMPELLKKIEELKKKETEVKS